MVHVGKGCTNDVEFQLKKVSCLKFFFALFCRRHIPFVISDRFTSVEHNTCGFLNTKKRTPETSEGSDFMNIHRVVEAMYIRLNTDIRYDDPY